MSNSTPQIAARPPPDPGLPGTEDPPLRSVHTRNFSAPLQELGISLLVTTYQAGKLVILRADGDRLNTHFRWFNKPTGLAVDGDRLAIGTSVEVSEYRTVPAGARRADGGVREVRGRTPGNLRRVGAAGGASPRRHQRPAARDRRSVRRAG